jgi:hypothetical protein
VQSLAFTVKFETTWLEKNNDPKAAGKPEGFCPECHESFIQIKPHSFSVSEGVLAQLSTAKLTVNMNLFTTNVPPVGSQYQHC